MSNRHLSRTIVLQALYEWDIRERPEGKLTAMASEIASGLAPKFDDQGFVGELLAGVLTNRAEIDELITRYAPEWPLDQITTVDRNVLRIGVYELIHSASVPSKVAINESIELAKNFGGESSGRFVNGVLGAIYRDRVAAGKIKQADLEEPKKKEEALVEPTV